MDVICLLLYGLVGLILYKFLDRIVRLPWIGGLDKRYVLVTGCDSGFGKSTARRLDALGCHVFAACLTEAGEVDLRKSCSSRLHTLHLDVSSPASVQAAYANVRRLLPQERGLWGIINNAGILGQVGFTDWQRPENYRHVADVNLYGLIDVTMAFLPLVKTSQGRIINVASIAGRMSAALPYATPYVVSKYGVEAFSDGLRLTLKPFGVSVHLIEPGFHSTDILDLQMWENSLKSTWNNAPEDVRRDYGESYCMQACAVIKTMLQGTLVSATIEDVVDAYTHALFGMWPRFRYVVGMDARLLWIPATKLPEWLLDFMLTNFINKDLTSIKMNIRK